MFKSFTTIVVTSALLCGCATDVMKGYIGKLIQEPVLDYGPPANVIDLEDGRRAYQWQIDSSGVIPMSSPSTSTVFTGNGLATVTTQSTSYIPYSNSCLYTLTAVKQGERYIVDGFRQPSFDCL